MRLFAVLFLAAFVSPLAALTLSAPVPTEQGAIRGEVLGQTVVFRGVPFAVPPVGSLRWRAPQPPAVRADVLDATVFGPKCAQELDGGGSGGSEDCLRLNLFAPVNPGTAKRPVMFWIHGGGNVQGYSAQQRHGDLVFDGQPLVERADVVVVTVDYRLGPFGFLAHPALSAEDPHGSSGNYGLLDQLAALDWVKKNIAAFGGDPGNVMIFGESGGATDVSRLVQSPLSAGLFARAAVESGGEWFDRLPLRDAPLTTASAEGQGVEFAADLGCAGAPDVLACMRGKSAAQLIAVGLGGGSLDNLGEWRAPVDGYVLPLQGIDALRTGAFQRVPILLGNNTEDGSVTQAKFHITSQAALEAALRIILPGISDERLAALVALYPPTDFGGNAQLAARRLLTDVSFLCPSRAALGMLSAWSGPLWAYRFAHAENPAQGAKHTDEIPYVFGSLKNVADTSPSAAELALADRMLRYWSNFARTGDPNASGLPSWPEWDSTGDRDLRLDLPIQVESKLQQATCSLVAPYQARASAGPCVPDATTLCLDHESGDRRFRVRIDYSAAAAGLSGAGRAIPLASLGVEHGGLFWFFDATNPEMLVKVLDGCALDGSFWVFASAGTNVGYVLTVEDIGTGQMHVYSNTDGVAAQPIQDTGALACD